MHPNPNDQIQPTTPDRRHDPDGTRRRHAFWRNVVGPQIDGDQGRQRRPVPCLID